MKFNRFFILCVIAFCFFCQQTIAIEWVETGQLAGPDNVIDLLLASDGTIYAAAETEVVGDDTGFLFRTDNGGETWYQPGVIEGAQSISNLSEGTDGSIYLLARPVGMYRTDDGGESFTRLTDIFEDDHIFALLATSDGLLYAGGSILTAENGYRPAVYTSIDRGQTWQPTTPFISERYIYGFHEASTGTVFARTDDDMFRTNDHGDEWIWCSNPGGSDRIGSLLDIGEEGENWRILAGIEGEGMVYASASGGNPWYVFADLPGKRIYAMLEDENEIIWVGGSRESNSVDVNVYYKENNVWNKTSIPGEATYVHDLIQTSDGYIFAATEPGGGVYKLCPNCSIDGVCYHNGDAHPQNPCLICDISQFRDAWTFNDGASCDDQNLCTTGEVCRDGLCLEGQEKDCDDENSCTEDSCDPQTGDCVYENLKTSCNDNIFCNGYDHCSNGDCLHTGDPCIDDLFCNGTEECDEETVSCIYSESPCGDNERCNENEDTCEPADTADDDDDDDNSACGCG